MALQEIVGVAGEPVDLQGCPFDMADVVEEGVSVNNPNDDVQADDTVDDPDNVPPEDQAEHNQLGEADFVLRPVLLGEVPAFIRPRSGLVRSAPVKRRPERWIVRQGGIRKSRRLASMKCKQMIKKIAVRLSNASDEEDDVFGGYDDEDMVDIPLVDDDQHRDDLGPAADDNREANIPQVDGNYTLLAGDVFSAMDIDYFSTQATDVLHQRPDRAYSLAQYLDLAVPTDGVLECNRVFLLPPSGDFVRSRILSTSEGQLSLGNVLAVRRPSMWRRQLQRLRGFLDRRGRR